MRPHLAGVHLTHQLRVLVNEPCLSQHIRRRVFQLKQNARCKRTDPMLPIVTYAAVLSEAYGLHRKELKPLSRHAPTDVITRTLSSTMTVIMNASRRHITGADAAYLPMNAVSDSKLISCSIGCRRASSSHSRDGAGLALTISTRAPIASLMKFHDHTQLMRQCHALTRLVS